LNVAGSRDSGSYPQITTIKPKSFLLIVVQKGQYWEGRTEHWSDLMLDDLETTNEQRSDYPDQDDQPAEHRAVPRVARKRRKRSTGVDRRRVTARRQPDRSNVAADNITITASNTPASIELWERKTVLAHFGGNKPLHVSTLYRGINTGIYPKPINTSGNTARWLADECRDALQRMISNRDKKPTTPVRRGRKSIVT
jgi:hypothetical protein